MFRRYGEEEPIKEAEKGDLGDPGKPDAMDGGLRPPKAGLRWLRLAAACGNVHWEMVWQGGYLSLKFAGAILMKCWGQSLIRLGNVRRRKR